MTVLGGLNMQHNGHHILVEDRTDALLNKHLPTMRRRFTLLIAFFSSISILTQLAVCPHSTNQNPCNRGEKIIRLVTQPIVENETTADFSHFEVDEENITSNCSSPAPSLTELQVVNPWIIELIDDDNPEMPTKYNNDDTGS
ncbi:uncharacterized protein LOC111048724 [Nilaparvata lugens]|uniref:uncharacterized protein LOC111048724 n=1 Tax=Nilaparvata lugens TaxID=108931 RepID=UPI00193D38D5|nr:uncharacterized protein LOC111048724 [Nilaparvata lugens]